MKLVHVLLVNLATLGVAFVAYDSLRAEPRDRPRESTRPARVTDLSAIEQRLEVLEAQRRAAPPIARAVERTDASRELDPESASHAAAPPADERRAERDPSILLPSADAPTAAEVQRFRRLQEAVRTQERIERNAARVDAVLDKLSLNLSETQRTRIHAAYASFQPRVEVIWSGAKKSPAAGGAAEWGTLVAKTSALIEQEFAATLADIVPHPADAEAVSTALLRKGR